ncbi:MAG: hypothetical protein IJS17_07240 [Clostridia bacterium]|nr:hypothetical protein [Clostridia bacterium]
MVYFIMTVTIVTAVTGVFDPGLASTGYVSTYPLVGESPKPLGGDADG